ncbi:hypothetical protein G6514_003618 [Epicoccum nigrum]|nr:hypothetical protein G6514_003618 [Epicoccum nigrum]
MAPTTRAATKKARNPPLGAGSTAAQNRPRKKAKKAKKAEEAKHAPVEISSTRCQLLELPPELRNRIYHFCDDNRYMGTFRKIKTGKEKPGHKQTGAFVALAQVCKKIQFEYRPLWLRQLCVRVDFSDLEEFLQVFYCVSDRHEDWYRDAPTILTIAWDHDESDYGDGDTLIPIESLLKLHAYSPASTIEFECRRLAESDLPCTDCWECGICVNCGGNHFVDRHSISNVHDSGYTCEHDKTIDDIISMADLGGWQELDYVVGVQTDKYSRSIDGVPEPVYDQALIRCLKSKARSASAQAGKQSSDPAIQG